VDAHRTVYTARTDAGRAFGAATLWFLVLAPSYCLLVAGLVTLPALYALSWRERIEHGDHNGRRAATLPVTYLQPGMSLSRTTATWTRRRWLGARKTDDKKLHFHHFCACAVPAGFPAARRPAFHLKNYSTTHLCFSLLLPVISTAAGGGHRQHAKLCAAARRVNAYCVAHAGKINSTSSTREEHAVRYVPPCPVPCALQKSAFGAFLPPTTFSAPPPVRGVPWV